MSVPFLTIDLVLIRLNAKARDARRQLLPMASLALTTTVPSYVSVPQGAQRHQSGSLKIRPFAPSLSFA